LKKDDLKGVKPDTGESYWKENKNIAGEPLRQLDGRPIPSGHVQRQTEAERRTARCELRRRGAASPRCAVSTDDILVGVADGSVRVLNTKKLTFITWTNALCPTTAIRWGRTGENSPPAPSAFLKLRA